MAVRFAALVVLLLFSAPRRTTAQPAQQSANAVLVDDSYVYSPTNQDGIQYSSGWTQFSGNDAEGRYLQTLSSTTGTLNNSAVFFFKGSSIACYGDRSADQSLTSPPPFMYISVDGRQAESISNSDGSDNQQPLWSISNLDEGDHQIIISRSPWQTIPSNWTVNLDYLGVTPRKDIRPSALGPGATKVASDILVDDAHEKIVYEGSWWLMVPDPRRGFFFGGLQHTTQIPGSNLTFSFNGTEVHYFSDRHPDNGWALISVDGGAGERVSTFLEPRDDRSFSQSLIWSKTGLSNGAHTVKITHDDEVGKYVNLDFFKYSSRPNKSKKFPVAGIVAAAVGGLVVLLVAVLLIYSIRRGRRSQPAAQPENPNPVTEDNPKLEGGITQTDDLKAYKLPYETEPFKPELITKESGYNERPTTGKNRDSPRYSDLGVLPVA